jgi:hypothetical protein
MNGPNRPKIRFTRHKLPANLSAVGKRIGSVRNRSAERSTLYCSSTVRASAILFDAHTVRCFPQAPRRQAPMFCRTTGDRGSLKNSRRGCSGRLAVGTMKRVWPAAQAIDGLEKPSAKRFNSRMSRICFGDNKIISILGKKIGIEQSYKTSLRQMHIG